MIVRTGEDGVELITQPDHAHLAERIMRRSVPLSASPRRQTILLAIREHDNGWAEFDAAPSVDPATGAIMDFVSAPLAVRHGVWPRGVRRLAAEPWAAALVAQHAITVYDRYRAVAEWTSFFAEMERLRDEMLRASGRPRADGFDADYEFVRLADLISLTFCTGRSDIQRFANWTVRLEGARVVVSPDAFGGATIPIEISARCIPRKTFRSDEDLRDALRTARTTTLAAAVTAATGGCT